MKNKILVLLISLFFVACSLFNGDGKQEKKLILKLSGVHKFGNESLALDTFNYTIAAGRKFKVSELRYILSDITFYDMDGKQVTKIGGPFYFDMDIDSTLVKRISALTATHYHTVSFVFGLIPEKNVSLLWASQDLIELMGWPDQAGGGYHFMQLSGRYLDSANVDLPLLVHIGRSKTQAGEADPHFVTAKFPVHVSVAEGFLLDIKIKMNIKEWFETPNLYDFMDYTDIMPNPTAQNLLKANGEAGVFSVEASREVDSGVQP